MNEVMQFRTADFNRKIDELIELTGKSAAEVLTSEGRLFTADVIKMTPPFSGAPSTESFNVQRKAGEGAVERDIKRVYITPTDAEDGMKIGRFELKIEQEIGAVGSIETMDGDDVLARDEVGRRGWK